MKDQKIAGIVSGFISALCVSGYFIVNKYVYSHHPITALEYTILFLFIGGIYGAISLFFQPDRVLNYKEIRKNIKPLIKLSIAVTLAMGFLIFGQRYTSSVNASIIATSTIVSTLVWSYILLKEKLIKSKLVWVLIMLAGLYIGIVGFKNIHLNSGDLIVLGSVIFFGFGNAFSRVVMKRTASPMIVPYTRLVLGGLFAAIAGLIFIRDLSLVLNVLPLTIIASGFYWLCMITFAKSVYFLDANEAIIINQSQIFFTSLAGVIILSENYSLEKFIGSVLVMISVYFITAHKNIGLKRRKDYAYK